MDAWSPAVVPEFLEWYRSRSVSRPHVSLPPRKPGTNGTSRRYRLAVGREIRSIGEADVVTVRAGAVELNLKKDVSEALWAVLDRARVCHRADVPVPGDRALRRGQRPAAAPS